MSYHIKYMLIFLCFSIYMCIISFFRIKDAITYRRIDEQGLPCDGGGAAAAAAVDATPLSIPLAKKRKMHAPGLLTNHISATRRPGKELEDAMTMAMVAFLVVNCLPFNIVANTFFQCWISILNPSYANCLPSRRQICRKWIPRLRLTVEGKIAALWLKYKASHPYRTLALDAVKTQRGDKINVVESSGPIVVFRKCIDSLGVSQNAKFYSGVIIDLITSGAKAANTLPKHIYGSVCMDNTTTNYAAFALIKPIFPWLICVGCGTHLFDLLIEDVFGIREFGAILKSVV